MADFGQELRAERERRGVSVERLCAETKVNARHFVALEVGDYLTLPGGVFRRGIVRAYLQALGLDEEEWLPRFQASIDAYAGSSKTGLETNADAWVEFAENVRKSRPG
jgi:cytoskeletal protein RodZ